MRRAEASEGPGLSSMSGATAQSWGAGNTGCYARPLRSTMCPLRHVKVHMLRIVCKGVAQGFF